MIARTSAFAVAVSLLSSSLVGADDGPLRIACVGDSITFGAGVANREENSYPRVLADLLGEGFDVRNFGVSGATLLKSGDLPYWKQKAFEDASQSRPDVVIIKLGTNDSKPHNWQHADEFARDLTAMVHHFQRLASQPLVLLCKPVPVAMDRWGIREAVVQGEVIPIVGRIARQQRLRTINGYRALADHLDLLPDGVHPNAAGARRLAEAIYHRLPRSIRKRGSTPPRL